MTRDDALEKIRTILSENFAVPADKVALDASFRSTFGLDSLDIVDLIFFLHKSFGYESELEEYRELHTVGKVVDFVMEKLG
jgi:acyl carrier protein